MRVPPRKLLGLLSLLAALAACGVTPSPAPINAPLARDLLSALPGVTTGAPSTELDGTHRPIAGLKLSIEPLALLFTGKGQRQTVRVVARDAQGNIVRLKKKSVTWRISDPKLVKLGNNMGKSESEPEPEETLEISTNRDDDGNAITITTLTDQGLGYISVTLKSDPTIPSANAGIAVRKLLPGVSVVAASKVIVGTIEEKGGGGFSPQEVSAVRSDFVTAAVVRGAPLPVKTLVSLEGPRGGLGRVVTSTHRGEFNLIGVGFASSEDLFMPYNKRWPVAPSSLPANPNGFQAKAGPIVPIDPNNPNNCKVIKGPKNINWPKLISFKDFKLNPEELPPPGADEFLIGKKFTPTGVIGIDPFDAIGGAEQLELEVQCDLGPTIPTPIYILPIPLPFPPGVLPIPLQGRFTPNLTFNINATKTSGLRLGFFVNNNEEKKQSIVVQFGGKFTVENGIPSPKLYPTFTNEPGDNPPANLVEFAKIFKPDLSLAGVITGFVPANAAITLKPISLNGAVVVALPNAPIDFINSDLTLLQTAIAYANGPSAAETKVQPGAGRTNISYVSGKLSLVSKSAETITNYVAETIKGQFGNLAGKFARKVVEKTLGAVNDKLKLGFGQNFGEANYLPLKPGDVGSGNSAVLSVTRPDGTVNTFGLKPDGSSQVSIGVGDKLELLVLSDAGDPSYTETLGGSLSITNKTRYSGLPTSGNVWDYSNRDTIPGNGFPGPRLPFTSLAGTPGLSPKPGLALPGNPPSQPPEKDFFYLAGGIVMTKGLCDQIVAKGEADWRITAENVIFTSTKIPPLPSVTSGNYLGGLKVTCGTSVDFFAGGNYTSPTLLAQDGQEVLVDCDIAFPIAINFKKGQTVTDQKIKYDNVLAVPDPVVLPDGTTLIRSTTTATAQDKANGGGTHSITAEAKGVGGQLKTSKRTFVLKCKDKLPPTINPPVIKAGNTVLGDGVTTFTVPVCPSDPRTFPLQVSMFFNPNGSSATTALLISGMNIAVDSSTVGSITYSDGSRRDKDSLTGRTEFITTGATITVSVIVSETFKPANKFAKDYVKNVQVNYVAKPSNQCQPPPPPPQVLCPPSSGPYALAATTACPQDNNSGDVHLKTKDGYYYDFQGVGEFVLARSSLNDMPFEVQTRYHPYGSSVSLTSAVAARVGTDRLTVYADTTGKPDVRINGQRIVPNVDLSWSQTLSDGGKLTMKDNIALVVWKDGSNLTVWSYPEYGGVQNAILQVHPRHKGRTVGLGGNYNDNISDELTMRNGTVLPSNPTQDQLYNQFGKSWRLSDGESLFDYAPGQNTATFTDLVFPLGTPAPVITPTAQTAAEAICRAAGVTTADALKGCIYDVVVTGDKSFASAAAKSDVTPLPPTPPAPTITVSSTSTGPLRVGESRTYTATVLNSDITPTWLDAGQGSTLIRTPGNPNVVTFRADLPGCYILQAGLFTEGNGPRYGSNYIYLAVDKNDCFPT